MLTHDAGSFGTHYDGENLEDSKGQGLLRESIERKKKKKGTTQVLSGDGAVSCTPTTVQMENICKSNISQKIKFYGLILISIISFYEICY